MSTAIHLNALFKPRALRRRYKVVRLAPELLMNLLCSPRIAGGEVEAYTFKLDGAPLPDDLAADAVVSDEMGNCLLVRLWSSTWPEVEWDKIPTATLEVTAHQLRLDRDGESPVTTLRRQLMESPPKGGWSADRLADVARLNLPEEAKEFAMSATETEWRQYLDRHIRPQEPHQS